MLSDDYNEGDLVVGGGGVLYGTTYQIGDRNVVYSLTPPSSPGGSWTNTTLYDLRGFDPRQPPAALAIGSDGVLYGTTQAGEDFYAKFGTVYSLTPPASPGGAWTETTLWIFTGGGGDDPVGLAIGKNGVLFGTTSSGGESNAGTVFALVPPVSPGGAWTESVLHSFTGGDDGGDPVGALVIGNGVLYGTTSSGGASNAGTVFSLKP